MSSKPEVLRSTDVVTGALNGKYETQPFWASAVNHRVYIANASAEQTRHEQLALSWTYCCASAVTGLWAW